MLDFREASNLYKKVFGKKSAILLLLSFVYASLSTLFVECGIYQEQILAIVGSDSFVMTRLLDLLRIFSDTKALTLASEPETFSSNLVSIKDDYAICPYTVGKRAIHNSEALEELFLSHSVNEQPLYSLVTILFDGVIPPEKAGNYLAVNLELCENASNYKADLKKFKEEFIAECTSRVSAVLDIMHTFNSTDRSLVQNAWVYAAADVFLALCGMHPSDTSVYETLMKEIEENLETSASLQDYDGISELVIKCLYEYASQSRTPMVNVNNLAEYEVTDLESVPFCDNEYYYFPDSMFRVICKPLFSSLTYGQINEALNVDEIQISQGVKRIFSTSKVAVVNVYGATVRKRMHKLLREKTDLPGDSDLETAFNYAHTNAGFADSPGSEYSSDTGICRIHEFTCPERGGDDYE